MGDSTNAATIGVSSEKNHHLTLRTRKCSSCSAKPFDISEGKKKNALKGLSRDRHPLNSYSILPLRSHRGPTPPLYTTLQSRPMLDSGSICSPIPAEPRLDFANFCSLVWSQYASHLSLSSLIFHAASTWMTDDDFLVHLHELEVQVLPFPTLDALVRLMDVHLSSVMIFILLGSSKISKIVSARLSSPVCWFPNSLRAHTRFSHTPCGGA